LQKLAMKKLEIANRIRTFVYNYNVFKWTQLLKVTY
jgi:hypothetical protein